MDFRYSRTQRIDIKTDIDIILNQDFLWVNIIFSFRYSRKQQIDIKILDVLRWINIKTDKDIIFTL